MKPANKINIIKLLLITCICVLSLQAGDFVLSTDDPLYLFAKHEFRMTHNPEVLSANDIYDSCLYQISDSDAFIRFLPQLKILSDTPDNQIRIWSASHWKGLLLYIEQPLVNSAYGDEHLGANYERAGMSTRIAQAYLRYQNDLMEIHYGRAPVHWGQSVQSSIIQSGYFPAYDHISARFTIGTFKLELLSGQLSSENIGGDRIKRYIAGHRITWHPVDTKWTLEIGDQILYTGVNRSIELFYLNPVIPYFFTALEGDETTNPDNDNSIIFLNGRYLFIPNLSTYFEFILDDYQVDKNTVPHALGYKIGLDGGRVFRGRELSFEFEYTSIDSWTYIHHGQFTSWQNRGHPLGYKYGSDCRSIEGQLDFWPSDNWRLYTQYTYLEKGSNNLNTVWDSPGTKDAQFPSPPATHHSLLVTSLQWFLKYGILEIGYSNYPVGNAEIDGIIDKPKGSLFIKAQLVWGFGYDLD